MRGIVKLFFFCVLHVPLQYNLTERKMINCCRALDTPIIHHCDTIKRKSSCLGLCSSQQALQPTGTALDPMPFLKKKKKKLLHCTDCILNICTTLRTRQLFIHRHLTSTFLPELTRATLVQRVYVIRVKRQMWLDIHRSNHLGEDRLTQVHCLVHLPSGAVLFKQASFLDSGDSGWETVRRWLAE